MPRFCTNCGAPLEDSARFCTNCGTQNTDPASVADESAVEEAKVTADIPELTLDETPEIDIPELTLDEAPVESDIPELTLDETPIARPTPPQQPAAEQPENDFIAPPAAPEPPPYDQPEGAGRQNTDQTPPQAQQRTGASNTDYQNNSSGSANTVVPGKNQATVSLVLGIVAVICWFFGFSAIVSVVCGIIGLIMASKAKQAGYNDNIRTAGFVLSLIGLIGGAIFFIACVACVGAAASLGSQL